MSDAGDAYQNFHARSGTPTIGYVAATRPVLEKAVGGVVHATSEDAFKAIDAAGGVGTGLNVYEVLVYVANDPMPPAISLA